GADLNRTGNFDGGRFDDVLFQGDDTLGGRVMFANMEAGALAGTGIATGNLDTAVVVGHGDVTGDGIADVVIASGGQITVAVQHGSGTPTFVDAANTPGFTVRAVADVNGDSFADIIVQNRAGETDYANMANGVFSNFVAVANTPGFVAFGAGDV